MTAVINKVVTNLVLIFFILDPLMEWPLQLEPTYMICMIEPTYANMYHIIQSTYNRQWT